MPVGAAAVEQERQRQMEKERAWAETERIMAENERRHLEWMEAEIKRCYGARSGPQSVETGSPLPHS